MGREIRKVPKGWEHPQNEKCVHYGGHKSHRKPTDFDYGKCFIPMYDSSFDARLKKWVEEYEQWKRKDHPAQKDNSYWQEAPYYEYAGSPPNPRHYRPDWKPEEMTCYQVYETVSEGTPVSPVFETLEDLKKWLVSQGHSEKAAERFIAMGSVPSGMFSPEIGFVSNIDICDIGMK